MWLAAVKRFNASPTEMMVCYLGFKANNAEAGLPYFLAMTLTES